MDASIYEYLHEYGYIDANLNEYRNAHIYFNGYTHRNFNLYPNYYFNEYAHYSTKNAGGWTGPSPEDDDVRIVVQSLNSLTPVAIATPKNSGYTDIYADIFNSGTAVGSCIVYDGSTAVTQGPIPPQGQAFHAYVQDCTGNDAVSLGTDGSAGATFNAVNIIARRR